MRGWRRSRGMLVTELDEQEAGVLRGLVGQVREMLAARAAERPRDELAELTGIVTGPSTPPPDRTLARLLPDFHRVDGADGLDGEQPGADEAGALRSLHEPALVAQKDGVAAVVLETLPPRGGTVRLTDEQARAWLYALNDARLALGTLLEVSEDMPDELPPDDPRAPHLGVYHWLTWVQESLVQAVAG